MNKGRTEAFSDGVFAILITIMVLELKVPQGDDLTALKPLSMVLFSYLLSFVFIGTYWVNHHHMFQALERVQGRTLWLNLHLLFWLSLIPFATGWLTASQFSTLPVAFYGFLLLAASIAYGFLARSLVILHGPKSHLALALGSDLKGKLSTLAYLIALPLAFVNPWFAYGLYILVALIWFVPDSRIEKMISPEKKPISE
jgi:uncharacterized membrane protein